MNLNFIPQQYKGKKLVSKYTFRDKEKNVIGFTCRYEDDNGDKVVIPFFVKEGDEFLKGIKLNPRPLFGLDLLADLSEDGPVLLGEGEKVARALQMLRFCGITSIGGAKAAAITDWGPVNGVKEVYLLLDNDAPGTQYGKDIYNILMALPSPPEVRLVSLPLKNEGDDVVDWIQDQINDWDGYGKFEEDEIKLLRKKLKEILEKAEPVPDDWKTPTANSFDWLEPNQIKTTIPAVKKLTPDMLPLPIKEWAMNAAYRMQIPLDFIVVPLMVFISSIIGAGCGICPKRYDPWLIIPNLWGGLVGRPTTLKSPAMKESLTFIEKLQAEYGAKHKKEQSEIDFEKLTNEAKIADLESQIKKASKGKSDVNIEELKFNYLELVNSKSADAIRRIFKTSETSPQSMSELQNQNPRGILVFRDELMALLSKWEREDGQEERIYNLEGWNGNGSYTDVKISRGVTECANICISIFGSIQPDKLSRYLHFASNGNNDGLMQRFQLAVFPDDPKIWKLVDKEADNGQIERVYRIIKILAETDFVEYGAQQTEDKARPFFRLTKKARPLFNDWLTNLQTVKLPQEDDPLMAEHLGKYRSLMPSLALIFHLIEMVDRDCSGSVTSDAVSLAIQWCDYLETHARRIYGMIQSPALNSAIILAKHIEAKKVTSPFTAKEVYDKHWHGLKDKQEVESACEILIEENWLIRVPAPPANGRPPAPKYHINPKLI